MAAILDFQNGDYFLLKFCNISASKHLRLLILVSKYTFFRDKEYNETTYNALHLMQDRINHNVY